MDTGRILWIAAHPDDETLAAPFLGPECAEEGSVCKILVLTHGEGGGCYATPDYCGADLGTIRARELQASAAFLGTSVELWELADTGISVDAAWASQSGGAAALAERLRVAILSFAPTAVLTFDPQHGSTCHAAHRAVGALALDVISRLDPAPPVFLIETCYIRGRVLSFW